MIRRPVSDLMSLVEALHFGEDRTEGIRSIPPERWPRLLALADETQLALPLIVRRRSELPAHLRGCMDARLARNSERAKLSLALYRSVAHVMERKGLEFLVLKGITHFPLFCDNLAQRPHFDLDFYCRPESIEPAVAAIARLGYQPVRTGRGPERDHSPAMILKTGFRWRGDYYDPALPLIVEPHCRFWNSGREGFEVSGAHRFWERRITRNIGGCEVPALDPVDDLSYTTWHIVKHLLRGNLRLFHVYELAHFIHRSASSDSFWREWRAVAGNRLTAEPIAFRLARDWFGCRMHPVVREEIDGLPAAVNRWFRLFAFSPVAGVESPNKDELFLHLALVRGRAERFRIASQRLLPMNPPRVVLDAHSQDESIKFQMRRIVHRARFLVRRAIRHTRACVPVIRSGLRWWRAAWPTA